MTTAGDVHAIRLAVGGEGLIGGVIARATGYAVSRGQTPWKLGYERAGALAPWLAFVLFVGLIAYFARMVVKRDAG